MRILFVVILMLGLTLGLVGCGVVNSKADRTPADTLFAPQSVRIHPVFTKVSHWVNTPAPDGLDVFVELQDGFGDQTKAAGIFVFDLFEYDPRSPDTRGNRVQQPWLAPVETVQQQRDHYDRTARAYRFQLESPGIRTDRPYVLSAQFNPSTGSPRVFGQLVLQQNALSR
jgi:hypothetical protein